MTVEDQLARLQAKLETVFPQIQRLSSDVWQHEQQLKPVRSSPIVNRKQADLLYGPDTTRLNLAAGGVAPLPLSGLLGGAGEVQPASIPEVQQLPELGDTSIKLGTVLKNAGVIYRRGEIAWEPIAGGGSSSSSSVAIAGGSSGSSSSGMLFLTSTQAGLAAIAAGLTPSSLVTVYVSDFGHSLVWNGTGWRYADGEQVAGFIQGFLVDPDPTTGWALCDGSTVTYLKSDGTTGSIALPNLVSASANAAYLKFGSPASATPNAATAPTLTMASYTPAGTVTVAWPVNVPTFSGASGTVPAQAISGSTGTGSGHTHSVTSNVAVASVSFTATGTKLTTNASGTAALTAFNGTTISSGATTVTEPNPTVTNNAVTSGAESGHTHTVGTLINATVSFTPSGTVAWPANPPTASFSGTPAVLTGTITSTAEPRNLILRPWFRR